MANTYSQLYIQLVLVVKNRDSLINSSWEENLYRFISGLVAKKEQKMIAINGMPDHIHILLGIKPTCQIPDLVREIKKSSNQYIKQNQFTKYSFEWQSGYGVFSYSHREFSKIALYIANQKVHHQKKNFKQEYLELLKQREIEFEEQYLFDWLD